MVMKMVDGDYVNDNVVNNIDNSNGIMIMMMVIVIRIRIKVVIE